MANVRNYGWAYVHPTASQAQARGVNKSIQFLTGAVDGNGIGQGSGSARLTFDYVTNQLYLSGIISETFILCSDVDFTSYLDRLKSCFHQPFTIVTEPKKTGRFGAIQNFTLDNPTIDKFFVANADTLFSTINPQVFADINLSPSEPIVFLGLPDQHRNDFAEVDPSISGFASNMQNSGLVILARDWVLKNIQKLPCDLDPLILNQNSAYIDLEAFIYDGGTPNRLHQIRKFFT